MASSISKKTWFHGLLPREDVKLLLKKDGDYLVRTSEPVTGRSRHLIISVMQKQEENDGVRHYVIREDDGPKFSVVENQIFGSVIDLLDNYRINRINEKENSYLLNAIGRQFWELRHEDIILTKTLGEGAFGEVKKGTLKTSDGDITVDVAVKVAKLEVCTKDQIKEIMSEARLMRNFDHKNVVKCYGTAALQEPLMVVMELVSGGGLDSYLTKNQTTIDEKLDIMYQVAQGIEYIHKQDIIHRDIAARNCLFGNGIVKVSDFGLSRKGPNYQMNPKNKVPIRWLAPETLNSFSYSLHSDVFAFGIFCWEVLENGTQPYPNFSVAEVHARVTKEDYRMPIGPETPNELNILIKKCWLTKPEIRPTSDSLVRTLSRLIRNRGLPVFQPKIKGESDEKITPELERSWEQVRNKNRMTNPLNRASKKLSCESLEERPTVGNRRNGGLKARPSVNDMLVAQKKGGDKKSGEKVGKKKGKREYLRSE